MKIPRVSKDGKCPHCHQPESYEVVKDETFNLICVCHGCGQTFLIRQKP